MAFATLNLLQGLGAALLMVAVGSGIVARARELSCRGPWVGAAYAYLLGCVILGSVLWTASHFVAMPLTRPWIVVVWAALAAASALGALPTLVSRRWRLLPTAEHEHRPPPWPLRAARATAVTLGLLVSAGILAQAASDSVADFDGRMTWTAHARYIRHAETVEPSAFREDRWLVAQPDYPLLLPLAQVATLELWNSVDERAMRPIYALFLPALLLVVWDGARRLAGELPALAVAVAAAGLPFLAFGRYGGAAGTYSDVPLACFWGGALALLLTSRTAAGAAFPAGVLLAGAALTKSEGLPLAFLALVAGALASHRDAVAPGLRGILTQRIAPLLPAVAPLAAALLLLRSWASGLHIRYSEDYLAGLGPEHWSEFPGRLATILPVLLERTFAPENWIAFWAVALVVTLAGARGLASRSGAALAFTISGAIGVYLVAYLASPWGEEVAAQVRVTWHRFLLQLLVPALLLVSLAFRELLGKTNLVSPSLVSPQAGSHTELRPGEEALGPGLTPVSRPRWRAWAGVLVIFLVASCLFLGINPRRAIEATTPDLGDPLFNVYVLSWGLESLERGFQGWWSPPIFHPTERALALSDHLLGLVLSLAPVRAFLPSPVAGYNLLLLLSFVLSGVTTAWVLRRSGASLTAAVVGGSVFAFSPFRWDQMSHLAVLWAQWVPLTLFLFHRLLERPVARRALFFLLAYALQVSGGGYLAYMIHVPLLIILVVHMVSGGRPLWQRRTWRVLVPTAAASGLLLVLVFLPYLAAPDEVAVGHDQGEIRRFGATLGSFVTTTEWSPWAGDAWLRLRRPENALFPGLVPFFLAAFGLWSLTRKARGADPLSRRHRWSWVPLLPVVAALILSDLHTLGRRSPEGGFLHLGSHRFALALALGGFLVWWLLRRARSASPRASELDPWTRSVLWTGLVSALLCFPLFFLPAAALLPGFEGMRVPARFYVFASFTVAFLAARGLDLARRWVPDRATAAGAALAVTALVLVELAPMRLPWHPVPVPRELPAVYHWLAGEPDVTAVLELPLPQDPPGEIGRMYAQLLHGKPLANGYSGTLPSSYIELRDAVGWPSLDERALALLRDRGISHLVLHLDEYRSAWPEHDASVTRLAERYLPKGEAKLAYHDERSVAFRTGARYGAVASTVSASRVTPSSPSGAGSSTASARGTSLRESGKVVTTRASGW